MYFLKSYPVEHTSLNTELEVSEYGDVVAIGDAAGTWVEDISI